jgi:hypothetical protein
VVAALGTGAGGAIACDRDGAKEANASKSFGTFQQGDSHFRGWHGFRGWHATAAVVTSYLGLTSDQVKDKLKAGQTLAQIANATPNKSADGLVTALVAPFKTKLDAAVAANTITSAQEATLLARLTAKFTSAVNATWSFHARNA